MATVLYVKIYVLVTWVRDLYVKIRILVAWGAHFKHASFIVSCQFSTCVVEKEGGLGRIVLKKI